MAVTARDDGTARAGCWCCGNLEPVDRVVRLGNHPEVVLCPRCAHWAAKQAGEIEDHGRSGPLVTARTGFRALRRAVVRHGWHRSRLVGPVVRRLGKRLP
jgi:hypothetical protein